MTDLTVQEPSCLTSTRPRCSVVYGDIHSASVLLLRVFTTTTTERSLTHDVRSRALSRMAMLKRRCRGEGVSDRVEQTAPTFERLGGKPSTVTVTSGW